MDRPSPHPEQEGIDKVLELLKEIRETYSQNLLVMTFKDWLIFLDGTSLDIVGFMITLFNLQKVILNDS